MDYVLITAARNEAQFIELTLRSVIGQSARPRKWIIVSDGSTDATDDIVRRYMQKHEWIELVRMPERRDRNFAGKAEAFNTGCARVNGSKYDAIGNLDGDVSFDSEYFSFLLQKLANDTTLGVVGTAVQDRLGHIYDYRFVNIEHVTGTCQLFRRECFEQIGGYVPVRTGGIDSIAVIAARMKGWRTRTFPEKVCLHHRSFGTAENGQWAAKFKQGLKEYIIGNHPLWEVFRVAYQITQRPILIGGIAIGAGYLWGFVRRSPRAMSPELVDFYRREQMWRLKKAVTGRIFPARNPAQSPPDASERSL